MCRLIVLRDAFNLRDREEIPAGIGRNLCDLIPADILEVGAENLVAILNGRKVDLADLYAESPFERQYDEVILKVVPRSLASLAYMAVFAVATGISFGVQYLSQKKEKAGQDISPTYGWDSIQNTTENGTVIPILYGKHRVAGQILSAYTRPERPIPFPTRYDFRGHPIPDYPVESADGKNKLSLLVGLSAGPISAINDRTIDATYLTGAELSPYLKINGNSVTGYSDCYVSYRMGGWKQSIIPGFDDNVTGVAHDTEITETTAAFTTTIDVDDVELQFNFPNGLYQITGSGSQLPWSKQLQIKYRRNGVTPWTTVSPTIVYNASSRSAWHSQYKLKFLDAAGKKSARAKYDIQILDIPYALPSGGITENECRLIGVNEVTYADVALRGVALCAVESMASEQLQGAIPNVTNLCWGKLVKVWQPSDPFNADTAQSLCDFNGTDDGPVLWGWNVRGKAAMHSGYVDVLTFGDPLAAYGVAGKMEISHLATPTTSTWDSATPTAPFTFKNINGDFDIQCYMDTPTLSNGSGVGFGIMDPGNGMAGYNAHVGVWKTGGVSYWQFYNRLTGTESRTTGSTVYNYLRITRVGTTFTFYTSSNGTSWTSRGSQVYAGLDTDYVSVGFTAYSPTAPASVYSARFQDFTVNDETCYSIECSSNHAWIIYDALTDEHWGIGKYVGTTRVDWDAFLDFAAYCRTQVLTAAGASTYHDRHRWDGLLDLSRAAWDTLQGVAACARGSLFMSGDKVKVAWDAPKAISQVFAMSNIIKGSFHERIVTPKLGPNFWEVKFQNEELDYANDWAPYLDPDIPAGEAYRREQVERNETTRRGEALREGLYLDKKQRKTLRTLEYEAGSDAIACEPGDVVGIAHDVPGWGKSGRIVSATTTSFVTERPVTLAAATTYYARIRYANDTTVTATITTAAGTWTSFTVSGSWTAPAAGDVWAIGTTVEVTKPFILNRIKRKGSLDCSLELTEYNADVYTGDATVPSVNYSELPNPRKFPIDPTGIVLAEGDEIMPDGSIVYVINTSFVPGAGAVKHEIYWRISGDVEWNYAGQTELVSYKINKNIGLGKTYNVAIVGIGTWGQKKTPSTYSSITIVGNMRIPADVTGFAVRQDGDELVFTWDAVADLDVAGYEIRGASSWYYGRFIAYIEKATTLRTQSWSSGTRTFRIKAKNSSGNYSTTEATITAVVLLPPTTKTLVYSAEASTQADPWWSTTGATLTRCTLSGGDIVSDAGETNFSYTTPALSLCGLSASTALNTWINMHWDLTSTVNSPFSVTPEVSIGGAWYPWVPSEYTGATLAYLRLTINKAASHVIKIHALTIQYLAPDFVQSGTGVSISAGGTDITFSTEFRARPLFTAQFSSTPTAGDHIVVEYLSEEKATIKVYDAAGSATTGTVSWTARGY